MPLYEYICEQCGERFEVLQPMGAGSDGLECPACGSKALAKQFSTFAGSAGGSASTAQTAAGCCRGTPT
ncbi:MAG: zinc ribbon domain-containing protein [Acidobacteria bacterium]|nr:zinc ribbon domain-containing protein [Acidobacteriota bacterium]